jgi:acetyl esterase/lipase
MFATCTCISGVFDIKAISQIFLARKFITETVFSSLDEDLEKASPYYLPVPSYMKVIPMLILNAQYDLTLDVQGKAMLKKLIDAKCPVVYKQYSTYEHMSIMGLSTQFGVVPTDVIQDILNFHKKDHSIDKHDEVPIY